MFRNALAALALAATAALPLAALAQYNGDTLLGSQSVVQGTLEQSISSKNAQVGDPFVLDVTPHLETKMRAVACYRSQFVEGRSTTPPTLLDACKMRPLPA